MHQRTPPVFPSQGRWGWLTYLPHFGHAAVVQPRRVGHDERAPSPRDHLAKGQDRPQRAEAVAGGGGRVRVHAQRWLEHGAGRRKQGALVQPDQLLGQVER